jgi:outer membrane protein assembly factor BamA
MPVQPYTIALRVLHAGRYGRDADDPRLVNYFLGSRQLVRGYRGDDVIGECRSTVPGECPALDPLFGSRTVVAKAEVRAPLVGAWTRDLRYGPVPAEIFGFADAGLSWSGRAASGAPDRGLFRSVGFGIRLNGFAGVVELSAARPLDGPTGRWRFVLNLQPGF